MEDWEKVVLRDAINSLTQLDLALIHPRHVSPHDGWPHQGGSSLMYQGDGTSHHHHLWAVKSDGG
jgi:hypothetical protein